MMAHSQHYMAIGQGRVETSAKAWYSRVVLYLQRGMRIHPVVAPGMLDADSAM